MAGACFDDAKLRTVNASRELRRLRYLQAMGLTVCVARKALPGARPSKRLGLRAGLNAAAPGSGVSDARAALRASLDQPAASTQRSAQRESAAVSGSPQPPAAGPATVPAGAEQFSIATVISGGRLWIEDLGGEALARERVQLMVAMGRALDHPDVDGEQPRVGQFDWPLSNNPQLNLGAGEASAALHSFLGRQLADHGCTAVMCCGDAAAARVSGARFTVPVHRLPDTQTLLSNPQRKRELWRTFNS